MALARGVVLATLMLSGAQAFATSMTIREEYSKLVGESSSVSGLGQAVFGERIDLATGRTSFTVPIVDVPGNTPLPVRLSRRQAIDPLDPTSYWHGQHHMGQWQLDVPYVHGVYARERGNPSHSPFSCSDTPQWGASSPPALEGFRPSDYWYGNHVYLSDAGSAEILRAKAAKTPAPAGYPYIASNGLRLRCLSSIENGTGSGYVGIDESGTTYKFAWKVELLATSAFRPAYNYEIASQGRTNFSLRRNEVRLYVTEVKDRHGNTVTYTWSGDELRSIRASDGREILLSYDAGKVVLVSAHGREWRFEYDGASPYPQFARLKRIVNPDMSAWHFADVNYLWNNSVYDQSYETYNCGSHMGRVVCMGRHFMDKLGHCSWMRRFNTVTMTVSMTAPSGVRGDFVFAPVRHARTGVPDACIEYSEPFDQYTAHNPVPIYYDVVAIRSKTLSGAGLPQLRWEFEYSAPTGKFYPHNEADAVKATTVSGTEPAVIYTFGKVHERDDNKLLVESKGVGYGAEQVKRYRYYGGGDAAAPFDLVIGDSDQFYSNASDHSREPVSSAEIEVSGAVFHDDILEFDRFARPTQRRAWSSLGYSKRLRNSFLDDLGAWTIGLPLASVLVDSNTGSETVEQELKYDERRQVVERRVFGRVDSTHAYHVGGESNGALKSTSDGRGLQTTFDDYFRGVPRRIGFAGGAAVSATVSANGEIRSVTDEAGAMHEYDYDPMGRIKSIVYPTGDVRLWNNTGVDFRPLTAQDWIPPGITVGQWRQFQRQGAHDKVTYFDALWRPVLTLENDTQGSGGMRSTRTTYDSSGRVVFQSYPVQNADLTTRGTHTEYDALDRPVSIKQDSEHGLLETKIEYLPGFVRRTTNPRQQSTTEWFQVFDTPSYDFPVRIESPENTLTTIDRDVWGKPLRITRGPKN